MIRSRVLLRALLTLLAVAVIAMPASGAHLHLCFDGSEAPASVHLTEDGAHHAGEDTDGHSDTDLDIGAPAIAKKSGAGFDLPGLMAVAIAVFRLPVPEFPILPRTQDVAAPVPSVYYILPPLRAPPV